jgi:hypothetical protein
VYGGEELSFRAVLGLVFSVSVLTASSSFAVTFTPDNRQTLAEFATRSGLDPRSVEQNYAATGMVICNNVYSTGQLTLQRDVITTAAHAFFDSEGRPRGDLGACVFSMTVDGKRHIRPIMAGSLKVGSRTPYADPPAADWAVVRLGSPIAEATPYSLAGLTTEGSSVTLLAHRHRGWRHDGERAIENCAIRAVTNVAQLRLSELAIDCSTGDGASGSAVLSGGDSHGMVGILVGWRSAHPTVEGPFSTRHMNVAVAVEGAFREALLSTVAIPAP